MDKRYNPNAGLSLDFGSDKPRFRGYAAVFNSPSEVLSERHDGRTIRFREVIRPGAFKDVLASADVRALINHDPNYVLARYRGGQGDLTLAEDSHGLRFEFEVDDELSYVRNLKRNVEKQRVTGCSFAFDIRKDGEIWREEEGLAFHDIHRVSGLSDISICTFPAYANTSVSVRCLQSIEEVMDTEHFETWLEVQKILAEN
jgi:HK97 family phage prohead protease